jgi:tetratricopeptide (TPR) repeat protein
MKKTLVTVWLFLACAMVWAVPTVQQVQTEVQQGHYSQAEIMMREVVDAGPGSARAHYLYAEILAHNGSFSKATEEAAKAKQLDPDVNFTQPEKFQALEKLLEREQKAVRRTESSTSVFPTAATALPVRSPAGGIPSWVWLAALGVVGYLLWRGLARSQATPAPSGSFGVPGTAPTTGYRPAPTGGYGSGAPYMNAPPVSPSRGLLKTGLAVAGGMAAGMMVDEMLHHRQGSGTDQLSGLQRGIDLPPTDDAANELEQRNVDFGNGNDWDAGSAGVDLGGGGSDDGGW